MDAGQRRSKCQGVFSAALASDLGAVYHEALPPSAQRHFSHLPRTLAAPSFLPVSCPLLAGLQLLRNSPGDLLRALWYQRSPQPQRPPLGRQFTMIPLITSLLSSRSVCLQEPYNLSSKQGWSESESGRRMPAQLVYPGRVLGQQITLASWVPRTM